MKIAISSENGFVSIHFGRCPSYAIVDIQDGRVLDRREIPNPGHQTGFLPRFLSEKGVEVIIAGGMGPRAQALFAEKNVRTLIGVQGPIDEVIEKFIRGELETGQGLCDHGHHREGACRQAESAGEIETVALVGGRICVSAKGPDIEAEFDPNFGRAAYFLIVDPDTLEFQSLINPYSQAGHGAGLQSAQFVAGQEVSAVLTGHVGPNAQQALHSAGIRVIPSEKRTVREAISELKGK